MNPRTLPQEQLVDWIRDCLALCDGADARGDEQLYNEALEELRVLFDEYLRRFPGQPLTSEDVLAGLVDARRADSACAGEYSS